MWRACTESSSAIFDLIFVVNAASVISSPAVFAAWAAFSPTAAPVSRARSISTRPAVPTVPDARSARCSHPLPQYPRKSDATATSTTSRMISLSRARSMVPPSCQCCGAPSMPGAKCVKIRRMPAPHPEKEPIDHYLRAAARAVASGIDTAPAALATADESGRPSVRIVLLRGVDARGFVFYTNYGSRKARDLTANPQGSLCQHWPTLEEQIRIEGAVELADPAESDAYFAGRPRDSQLGAWASDQSAVLDSRAVLEARVAEIETRFAGRPVPRPPFWGGFRLVPDRMEFWYGRLGRLHDRLLYTRTASGWATSYLFP